MNATIGIGVNERVVTVGAETVEPDAVATVASFDHHIFEDTGEFVFAKFDELVGAGGLLGQELNDEIGGTFDPKPIDTIEVFVNGDEVPLAVETVNDDGTSTFSDGWTYNAADNAVQFHGAAIPDYNAEVWIYYLPLIGMPRELPF